MDLVRNLRWRDLVDILVVATVLYRAFVMFRGTRAIQMVGGLALLMAASFLADRLELHSTSWILGNFWSFWVIALVVLFQPELRRALAQAGRGGIVRTVLAGDRAGRTQAIADTVAAAEALAAKRIGALIVFERTMGVRHYAELGVPLDALVSADLLTSLFLPYSPLHDGAVFIQGDRVIAAGCFLPLSRNMQLGRALGTRHRAALGISEETDAVAVIVSEETGRISLAVGGEIETVLGSEALRQRLMELLASSTRRATIAEAVRRRLLLDRSA